MSKIHESKKWHYAIEMEYDDDSTINFEVSIECCERNIKTVLMMITRGMLLASAAVRVTAYDEDGFDVVSYTL